MNISALIFSFMPLVAQSGAYPMYNEPETQAVQQMPSANDVLQSFLQNSATRPAAQPRATRTTSSGVITSGIEEAFMLIREEYAFAHRLQGQVLADMRAGAIKGMIEGMGDDYSTFVPAREIASTIQDLNATFTGIGAQIDDRNDTVVVVTPLRESPAYTAGIKSGDIIIAVDDESIVGKNATEAVELIRGPRGSWVTLTVVRNTETIDIEVQRDIVELPAVTLTYENGVPVLGIHQFISTTAADVRALISTILEEDATGIIIDLRSNPGGYVQSAIDVAEFFLREGDSIITLRYANEVQVINSNRTGELSDIGKIVIVQDNGSASASEMLAGALRDSAGAQIVGQSSFGKGTMQEFLPLENGVLKLTVAAWYTPSGQWVSAIPLQPQIDIETQSDDTEQDEALAAAARLIVQ